MCCTTRNIARAGRWWEEEEDEGGGGGRTEHVALVNSMITPSITDKITACFSVFSAVDLLVKNKFVVLAFEAYTLCKWRRLLHSDPPGISAASAQAGIENPTSAGRHVRQGLNHEPSNP